MLALAWPVVSTAHASPTATPLPWPNAKPGPKDDAPQGDGRWQRALARREAELARERGRSPGAILALLGVVGELHGEINPRQLRTFVRRVADDRGRHPLVRSYARWTLAAIAEAEGDFDGAKALLEADGRLLAWQIVGPFDNGGRRGETTVYAPETLPYAADQTFTGVLANEALGWRVVDYDSIPRAGYVSFDDLLRPNRDATGYATAWVYVPADTDALLQIGTGGPYEVWINGRSIGSGRAYRNAHVLQDAYGLSLARGWNRILLKVSVLERAWGFHARLALPSGDPLPGLVAQAEPPAGVLERPPTPSPKPPPRVASLRAELERAHAEAPARRKAKAGTQLLHFYRHVRPFDFDDDTVIALAREHDARVGTAETAWLLAHAERDPNETFKALRAGIERARRDGERGRELLAELLLELGVRERSVGLEDRYRDAVDEAHALLPDDALVELALVDRVGDAGYGLSALEWLEDLVRRNPESITLARELASRQHRQGHSGHALVLLERLQLIGERIELLLELGRPDDATALASELARRSPGLPAAHVVVARLEEARGNVPAAREAWARAIALAPQDAEQHAELARLLVRHGDREGAIVSLRRSLELKPQQPDVRDLLAALEPASDGDLFARYAVELARVARTPTPDAWQGKSSGVLHHRVAVKVLPNGLTERLDHRIVRILDDRGVRGEAVQSLRYDPAESIVEVRRARVRRKNGTIEEIGDVRISSIAQAGYRMYYDQRQIRVVFGGLEVGDTLEVAFLVRDVAARNMFDEYFGDIMPLSGIEPRLHVEYVLEAPHDKPIYFNLADVEVTPGADGKSTIYRHVEDAVPAIKPEAGMPGWTEIARYLHASTYRTWDDVGNWYWELVREQLVVDDDVRAAVQAALAGLPANASVDDRVARIYEYVVRNTRYVGLEFGIHGYKPYRTTEVLSRRFGDCKDKASLLKVMLGEAGVDSHLVLVRTRDQGRVPGKPASLAIFNHAITYVPALDLYLDGTAEWSGPRELPAGDQGASVLVVKDGQGAEFRTIPVSHAQDNVRETSQTIALHPDGSAAIEHALVVKGAAASGMRYGFQSQEQRNERLANAFGEVYPGVEVEGVAAPAIGDILQPARIEARLRVPEWARGTPEQLRFRVLGRESTLTQSLASRTERTHELVLDVPSIERNALRYRIPRGYRFARTPDSQAIESPVGRFDLRVTPTEDGAEVESALELREYRIRPQDYAAFREFLQRVDEILEQNFEIVPDR